MDARQRLLLDEAIGAAIGGDLDELHAEVDGLHREVTALRALTGHAAAGRRERQKRAASVIPSPV